MFTESSHLTLVARTAISSLFMIPADEPVAAETLAFVISFCESFARLFQVCCMSNAIRRSRLAHGNGRSLNGALVAARSGASLYLFVAVARSLRSHARMPRVKEAVICILFKFQRDLARGDLNCLCSFLKRQGKVQGDGRHQALVHKTSACFKKLIETKFRHG